ncbi:hypothetical protein OU5_P0125 (plasmid) [Pseudomonas mandelii JR-1]|uniref:Uncharacterized protein n=1 Tax=Pseudomonas mandelii JR-1 TaxID=1147786 RepID=A0A024EKQ5_9PSED|nr:hypothetical protein OU5_P0125 [Pseudomonas mandelii JR-1]
MPPNRRIAPFKLLSERIITQPLTRLSERTLGKRPGDLAARYGSA